MSTSMSDSDELPAASAVGLGCSAVLGLGGGGGMSELQGRAAGPCCLVTAACACHRQCLCHIRDNNTLDAVHKMACWWLTSQDEFRKVFEYALVSLAVVVKAYVCICTWQSKQACNRVDASQQDRTCKCMH